MQWKNSYQNPLTELLWLCDNITRGQPHSLCGKADRQAPSATRVVGCSISVKWEVLNSVPPSHLADSSNPPDLAGKIELHADLFMVLRSLTLHLFGVWCEGTDTKTRLTPGEAGRRKAGSGSP